MQEVTIERSTLRVMGDELPIPKTLGLTVDGRIGGLSLLIGWSPKPGEMVRVHTPRYVKAGGRSVEASEVAPVGNRVERPGDSVDYSPACKIDQPSVAAPG